MATTLYFVQNDTRPQIKLTLSDEISGLKMDLSSPTLQVNMHVKPATGTGVSFTTQADKTNPSQGEATITWVAGDLNRPAGTYNAEIEIYDSSTGYRETVYDFITLVIRQDIGDVPNIVLPPSPSSPPPNTNP